MDTVSRTRDEWMALGCQAGEPEAFEDFVAELERPLRYYAAKLVGNDEAPLDVLQDVWPQVFKTIGSLNDPGAMRSWAYRLTHGVAVDRVRASISRERAEEEAIPDAVAAHFFTHSTAVLSHPPLSRSFQYSTTCGRSQAQNIKEGGEAPKAHCAKSIQRIKRKPKPPNFKPCSFYSRSSAFIRGP